MGGVGLGVLGGTTEDKVYKMDVVDHDAWVWGWVRRRWRGRAAAQE